MKKTTELYRKYINDFYLLIEEEIGDKIDKFYINYSYISKPFNKKNITLIYPQNLFSKNEITKINKIIKTYLYIVKNDEEYNNSYKQYLRLKKLERIIND